MLGLDTKQYPREFRPDIQAMRCVAVLLVVFWHAGIVGFHGGFLGVDVFFVVSGFVITNVLLSERAEVGRASITRFYARRIRRILPAATVVLIGTVFLTYHYLAFIVGGDVAEDAKFVARFWGNFRFSSEGQNYFTSSYVSTLTQFWSLAVEEQFYFVWPMLFIFFSWGAWRRHAAGESDDEVRAPWTANRVTDTLFGWWQRISVQARLVGALLVVIGLSMWYSIYESNVNTITSFYSPFTRAWELALGALIAVVGPWLRGRLPVVGLVAQIVGTCGIFWYTWHYTSGTALAGWPGTAAIVPVLLSGAIIAGGSLRGVDRIGRVVGWKPIQWVGNISYSLYLVHYPIIIIAEQHAAPQSLPWYIRLALVELSVQVAAVLYYLVENPIRRTRILAKRRVLTYALGGVLVGASYAAIYWHIDHPMSTFASSLHAVAVIARGSP